MPARVRLALMVFASLAILAAAGVIVFTRPDSPPPLGASGFAGGLRPAIPPKDFTLRDQDGHAVSLRDYRGQVVVLTFMYSTCQDTCPVTATTIRGALDDLGHDVPALAVERRPRARHARLGRGVPGQARAQRAGACASCWARAPSSRRSGTTTASAPGQRASSTPPTCC